MLLYEFRIKIWGDYEDAEAIEEALEEHLNYNGNDVRLWLGQELSSRVEVQVD